MHNPFQKFSFFTPKSVDNGSNTNSDKIVKLLYKKETKVTEKSPKRKIRSANGTENNSHFKKSDDRHHSRKKKEPVNKNVSSESEVYFISPEEIKRHKRQVHRSREKSFEKPVEISKKKHSEYKSAKHEKHSEKRKSFQGDDDIVKLIKHYKQKTGIVLEDHDWLAKKDIFKLLNNIKLAPKPSGSLNLLKKLFLFEKEDSKKQKTQFIPFKMDDPNTKVDKIANGREKKKHEHITMKPKSSPTREEKLVFDELETSRNKNTLNVKNKENVSGKTSKTKIKSESEARKHKQQPSEKSNKEELRKKLPNFSRANPLRHKYCLVKNTFSIIDIPPQNENFLEKRRKLKAFKKYYKYVKSDKDSEIASSAYQTFSDSHKMYQDFSEQSLAESAKKRNKKKRSDKGNLQLETHVSAVVISPKISQIFYKEPYQNQKKTKIRRQKSKIPVLNSKIIELADETLPTPKSRQVSAELFIPKKYERFTDDVSRKASLEILEETHDKPKIKDKSSTVQRPQIVKSTPRGGRKDIEKSQYTDKSDGFSERSHQTTKTKDKSPGSFSSRSASVERKEQKRNDPSSRSTSPERRQTPRKILAKKKDATIPQKEVKNVRASTLPKPMSKANSDASKQSSQNKSRSSSVSPVTRNRGLEEPKEKKSNDCVSSVWSKSSKRTNKSPVPSKSDTRIQNSNKVTGKKKFAKKASVTNASVSNSTFGDKSMASSKNETSFFLTKSYKDDDKWNRWQKRKMYSDTIRKNLINKGQKESTNIPPQVLEVRYLTVTNDDHEIFKPVTDVYQYNSEEAVLEDIPSTSKEFYDEDLPPACMELVEPEKFKEIFDLPTEIALDEILNENYNFLKKDFSFTNLNDLYKYSSSEEEEDVSSGDLLQKSNDWYNFRIPSNTSINEIFTSKKSDVNIQNLDLNTQDIVDSLSAPGSEESGYSTIKSRQMSRSFFERPEIKALFEPPLESSIEDCYIEVQIERTSSCGLEIRPVESKSLQTCIESSQKSVQIKLSQEAISEGATVAEQFPVEATDATKEETVITTVDKFKQTTQIFRQSSKKKLLKYKRRFQSFFLFCLKGVSSENKIYA